MQNSKGTYAYWDIPFCHVSAKQSIRGDGNVCSGANRAKSSKQFHRPPSKMHGNPSTTVVVECFAERKSHTRLSSLEGLFGYNLYSWLL